MGSISRLRLSNLSAISWSVGAVQPHYPLPGEKLGMKCAPIRTIFTLNFFPSPREAMINGSNFQTHALIL